MSETGNIIHCYLSLPNAICWNKHCSILNLDERVVFAPLTELQIALYEAILAFPSSNSVMQQSNPCDCASRKARNNCCHKVCSTIFTVLLMLTRLSNLVFQGFSFHQLLTLLLQPIAIYKVVSFGFAFTNNRRYIQHIAYLWSHYKSGDLFVLIKLIIIFVKEFYFDFIWFKLTKEDSAYHRQEIFHVITLLRKVANHVALLLPYHKASEKQKELVSSYLIFPDICSIIIESIS